jgi:hypothetical protein
MISMISFRQFMMQDNRPTVWVSNSWGEKKLENWKSPKPRLRPENAPSPRRPMHVLLGSFQKIHDGIGMYVVRNLR